MKQQMKSNGMNVKSFILYFALVLLAVQQMAAETYDGTCGDNLTWSLDTSTGVLSISGTGEMTSYSNANFYTWSSHRSSIKQVVICSGVTSIGNNAFNGCGGLSSVSISDGVTSIGNYAFTSCNNLPSINIPNGVTSIGRYSFYGCSSLASITIPSSVNSIGEYAFCDCSGLMSINIPKGVTSIEDYTFHLCENLTSVSIPESVTTIGYYAFRGCSSLSSIAIPNSVTGIGEEAFSGCSSITTIVIPRSVNHISPKAFSNCSGLTSITVEEGNTIYDSRDNCNAIIKTVSNALIVGCANTTIPSSIVRIEEYAFDNCRTLQSVAIPGSVTSIYEHAFSYCINLNSITLPSSVKDIDSYAFSNCTNLTNVTIENDSPCWISSSPVFSGCSSLHNIYVPYGTADDYKSAAGWADYSDKIVEYGDDEVSFTMTDAGWGTLIVPFDHSVPDGLKAYKCGGYTSSNGVNWLTLDEASTITANTPYILAGEAGTYVFTGTPNMVGSVFTEGLLTGVYVPTTINEGSVLQNQDGEVAFYSVAASDPKTVPAYRCYLNSSAPSGSVAFRLGGTTGIEELTENESDGVLYDLQGRSVCGPLKNGVYIRNGKMILVK